MFVKRKFMKTCLPILYDMLFMYIKHLCCCCYYYSTETYLKCCKKYINIEINFLNKKKPWNNVLFADLSVGKDTKEKMSTEFRQKNIQKY